MTKHSTTAGFVYILGSYGAFSVADAFAKYMGQTLSTPATMFLLYGTMTLLALLAAPRLGGFASLVKTPHLKLHLWRSFFFAIGALLFISAFQRMPIARAYTIVFTVPFVSAALAVWLLKEKATMKRWLIIACGFSGVLIVLRPGFQAVDAPSLLALVSVLPLATYLIFTRKIPAGEPPLGFAVWPGLAVVTASLGLMIGQENALTLGTPQTLACLAGGGAIMAAQIMQARGFSLVPVSAGVSLHYSQIIWGIAFGYFFFNETPDLWTLAGIAVIVASGLALIRQEA